MRLHWLWIAPCLVVCAAAPALAQRTTATVRGTIVDQSQALMPGVAVTARNEDTGLTRETITNDAGAFALPDLPIGRYRVDAKIAGFKSESRTDIPLRVADDYVIDFTLAPGDVTEVVTVAAASTPVKLLGGDVSGIVTGQQVRELPLNGRNFLQLATLMPGVSAPDFLNVKDKGLLGGSDLSISGGDVGANIWTVDGANNNDVGSNRTILVYPSIDAIEEFKILRNSYGPEFGGAGGAQINIVTRGGTNLLHGSGFYSGRNDAFNATNYFLEKNDQPKEELSRHDFGATIGGPLIKDKLHYFGSLEWNLEDRGTARTGFVPTEAERRGDFSQGSIPGCSGPIPNDPLTGQPFASNRIPANRLSPAGMAYLNLYPLPNVSPAAGTCNNWVAGVTSPIDYNQQHVRVDWSVSNASRVMARYTHDSWKNGSPNIYSNLWGDDPFPIVDSNWEQPGQSFVASLSQTLGATANNSLQFSYSGNRITVNRGGDEDLNAQLVAAMPGIFPVSGKEYGGDIGHPLFWGAAGYPGLWNEAPFRNSQDLFIVKDDYTQVFGKHFVKAGALVSFNKKNEDSNGNGSSSNWIIGGSAGLTPNRFNGTGNFLGDLLLRDMTFGFTEFSSQRQVPQRWRDLEFYIADSWQMSPRITVDIGLRYSLFFNPYADDDQITNFVPELFSPALGTDACNGLVQPPGTTFCQDVGARGGAEGPNRSLMEQDSNNFAPRLGVAWDVHGDGRTAVRAGLGLFYLRERMSPGLSIAGNPPFVTTLTGVRKLDTNVEPCAGCFGQSIGTPNRGRELDGKTPNNWQWNVSYQQELVRNATLEVGYVGSKGYDLLRTKDINQVRSGDSNGNGVSDRLEYARSQPANAALRPFGTFGNTDFIFWDHTGESSYHSLQTQFISRFGRGSQVQASYTLSRSRSNIALTSADGGLAANMTALDLDDFDSDWGRPETGRTHIFNASVIWLLSSLEDKSGFVRGFFGDWEVTAIVGAGSGQPFTAYVNAVSSASGNLNGGPSGLGYDNNQRPNRTGEPCEPPSGAPDEQVINAAAYTLNGFPLGSIGTARRGDCTGPSFFQTDLAFYKNFRLNDTVKLQFRWDIFNFFNNTNFLFAGMNNTMGVTAAVYDTGNPLTANQIVSAVVPTNFAQATRTRDPRQMQFGLKVIW